MDVFPRTFDTSGRRPDRRRKRLLKILILLLAIFAAIAAAIGIPRLIQARRDNTPEIPSSEKILMFWSEKDYDSVLSLCEEGLLQRPIDPLFLVLKGFSSFYRGIGETDGEIRVRYMDDSIFALRKAMTAPPVPFKPQVLYVLGKAYYHKGPFYMDEAVRFLETSIQEGYSAKDTLEYVAVAYSSLGDYEKSVEAFERALAVEKSDLLLLAAARAYIQSAQEEKAEVAALEALSLTEDSLVREKSRFLLGELYVARKDYRKAEEQYNLVLEINPESADAHYYLGLIWQEKGDSVRARAEWRKAVSLDPMHTAARQKLAERI